MKKIWTIVALGGAVALTGCGRAPELSAQEKQTLDLFAKFDSCRAVKMDEMIPADIEKEVRTRAAANGLALDDSIVRQLLPGAARSMAGDICAKEMGIDRAAFSKELGAIEKKHGAAVFTKPVPR